MDPPIAKKDNNIKTIMLNSSQNSQSETPSGITVVKGGIVSSTPSSRDENFFDEEERFSETSTLDGVEGLDSFIGGGKKVHSSKPASHMKPEHDDDASSVVSSSTHSVTSEESVATVELLSGDPLFIVLSQFFMSKESGDNIATILEKINKNLEALVVATKGSQ